MVSQEFITNYSEELVMVEDLAIRIKKIAGQPKFIRNIAICAHIDMD